MLCSREKLVRTSRTAYRNEDSTSNTQQRGNVNSMFESLNGANSAGDRSTIRDVGLWREI